MRRIIYSCILAPLIVSLACCSRPSFALKMNLALPLDHDHQSLRLAVRRAAGQPGPDLPVWARLPLPDRLLAP